MSVIRVVPGLIPPYEDSIMNFVCTCCGKEVSTDTKAPACDCGGLFELDFVPPAWDDSKIDRDTWSLFRYRAFMALEGDAWKEVTMGEGMTPVIPFSDDVLVKMDYCMPTLSFKDRGAAALVAHMKSIGVKKCVQDSSGNAGIAVAAYGARAGIECEIYVPEGTSPKKIAMIEAFGAKAVVVPGDRDHCADVCRAKVRDEGAYYANHVFNPFFYEGTKTYIYEVFERLHRMPENIFIELGNGTLFIGAVKALEHLYASGAIDHFPQVIAVQGANCAPFAETIAEGAEHIVSITPKPTMAEGIAIGKPARADEILAMIRKHKIRIVCAAEEDILPARAELAHRGIYAEHTTAASLAAYYTYCRQYGPTHDALLSMCSAGIKSDH